MYSWCNNSYWPGLVCEIRRRMSYIPLAGDIYAAGGLEMCEWIRRRRIWNISRPINDD